MVLLVSVTSGLFKSSVKMRMGRVPFVRLAFSLKPALQPVACTTYRAGPLSRNAFPLSPNSNSILPLKVPRDVVLLRDSYRYSFGL